MREDVHEDAQEAQKTAVAEEAREILDLATLLISKAHSLLDFYTPESRMSDGAVVRQEAARRSGALVPFPLPRPPVIGAKRCASSLSDASVSCAHARFVAWRRFHQPTGQLARERHAAAN